MAHIVLLLSLFLALALPAQAATFFVSPSGSNGNPGSLAQPFQTINRGIQALSGGDTLYIRAGTYNEPIGFPNAWPPSGLGSWSTATVIAGYPGDARPILRNGQANVNLSPGGLGGAAFRSWIILDHLDIDGINQTMGDCCPGTGSGGEDNVVFGYNDHMRLSNSIIRNAGATNINGKGAFNEIVNNDIMNARAQYGLYIGMHESILDGNRIHNNNSYGLHFFDSGQSSVNNNKVRNNIFYGNGFNPAGIIHGGQDNSIVLSNGTNYQFYNNLIYDNANGLTISYTFGDNHKVYNNTFYNNWSGITISCDAGSSATGCNGGEIEHIRNNIVMNNRDYNMRDERNSPSHIQYGTNICERSGAMCTTVGTVPFESVGLRNFHLTGPTGNIAINAGVTLSEVATDLDAVARPQGAAYDIGAYEYVMGGGLPPSGNPIYLSAGGHSDVPTDAGDCTVPENILTPRATLAAALACMQVPGKVLYIRGGTYADNIDTGVAAIVGGIAADNPTRIEAYGNETVLLALPVGKSVGLFLRDVSYITVKKLVVDALGRAGSNAFACINADHLVIEASTFRNSYYEPGYLADCTDVAISQTTFHTSQVSAGVTLDGAVNNLTLAQVEIHTIPAQGLKANVGSGSNTNLVVKETQIHGTGQGSGGHGLDLGPGSGALIVNTIIDHNAAGVRVRSGASSVKVYQNAVASNVGTALQCDVGAGPGVTITNNIAFGNGTNTVVNNCGAVLAKNLLGVDPLWTDIAGRNFVPGPTSPAIDMGDALAEVTIAIDGTPRPHPATLIYDAGPYETWKEVLPPVDPGPPGPLVVRTRWLGMLY